MNVKVWILIPAYNEAVRLKLLLERLKQKSVSVLVVDDGSSDNTHEIAENSADIVLINKENSGKGLSLRRGMLFLLANVEFDYVITMDADAQHSPEDVDDFLKEAARGEAFVIGNRMDNPIGMPLIRIFTNKFIS